MHNSIHSSKKRKYPLYSCLGWAAQELREQHFHILLMPRNGFSLLLILIGLSLDINAPCQGGDMTLLLSSTGSRHLRLMWGWGLNMGSRDSIHLLTSPWRQCPVLSILALIFDTSSITEDEEEPSREPGWLTLAQVKDVDITRHLTCW